MKTRILLFFVLILSTGFVQAQRATIPANILNPTLPFDLSHSLIEQGSRDDDDNEVDNYYAEYIAENLYSMAEELLLAGVARVEHVDRFNCRIEELKNLSNIVKSVTDDDIKECLKNVTNSFGTTCKTNWTFSEIFPIVDSNASDFDDKYRCDGVIRSPHYAIFDNSRKERTKAMFEMLYAKAILSFIVDVRANTQMLANEYEMASVKQCKPGLHRLPFAGFEAPNSCKKSETACSNHSECCSEYCDKEYGQSNGVCRIELACYRLLNQGELCGKLDNGKINPFCDNQWIRHQLDPNANPRPAATERTIECIETNFNTSEIGECTTNGKQPTASKPCCSDRVGSDGKCILKMSCDVCLKGGQQLSPGDKCCPGFYPSLKGICIQDFPPLMLPIETSYKKINIFEKIFNWLIPSVHANESNCIAGVNCSNNLTEEDEKTINAARRSCLTKETQAEIDNCLKETDSVRVSKINENIAAGESGAMWDRQKYLSEFNMTAITSKTASDFKTCTFNSFNDAWRSASNLERNAEIVLRGFEYTFSGKGTKDYWLDKNGLSIYERAHSVAKNIRKYRTELINKSLENDRKMACKCIAIMGPANFPEKENFFNSKCEEEKAQLTEDLAGADGASSQAGLSQVEKDQAVISEIDLGASGVSHEKLLLEYTNLRMETQFDRFQANAALERELTELAEFINEQNWELSWEKSEPLYEFVVTRTAGWITWVTGIIAAIAVIAIIAGSLGTAAIVALAVVAVVAATGAIVNNSAWKNGGERVEQFVADAADRSITASGIKRNVYDEVKQDWYTRWFTEYKHFKRHYITPYFKTNASETSDKLPAKGITGNLSSDKICDVYGSSRVCFKNVHATIYEEEPRFLLDAKFPEFVAENAYEADSQFIKKVNEGYDLGILRLKATDPQREVKTKWLEKDILGQPDIQNAFKPDQGRWIPESFDESRRLKLQDGVKKYARCLKLINCGARYLAPDEQDALGFGFLFENEQDVEHFASYVYQHHFHWPSISTSGMMAYPTMAMSSYFEAIVYNLKILGSMASLNGLNMGELYDKYEADWNKRKADYDCTTPGCANAQMGGTRNVKYSKEFRAAFKRLNLKTGANIEQMANKNGEVLNTQGLSQSEIDTLNAAGKMALRAADHQKKFAHYQNTVGNTERGKLKQAAQKSWGENFSAPLNNMPLTVGGQQYGMLGGNNNNKSTKKEETAVASYTPPKYDFKAPNYDFGSQPNYNSASSNSSDEKVTKGGLRDTNTDNMYLLESAQKNQEMFKRDDADSIFQIVSKAYYRNLSLILVKQGDKTLEENKGPVKDLDFKPKGSEIDNKKKEELKKLLSQ